MAREDLTSIDVRCRPRQARSVATFQRILDTAGELLERDGAAAFTTNLLSDASGVSIQAIYRYFPNKQSVIAELAQQMASRWRRAVSEVDTRTNADGPLADNWGAYLAAFESAVRATPGARAVLRAMRDDPLLRAIDDAANRTYTADIVQALQSEHPGMPIEVAEATATVLMRSTVAVLDEAFESEPAVAAELIRSLEAMHLAFLSTIEERSR